METTEKQGEKQWTKNLKPYQWKKGVSGNPAGRPKGQTLKEFAREYLMSLPPDEKVEFLAALPPEITWKMAEGNPQSDVTSGGEKLIPIPIIPLKKNDIPADNSDNQNIGTN